MASPLSILSPLSSSKQNARSPLVESFPEDHIDSKQRLKSPRTSLGIGFTIYDENASPCQTRLPSSPVPFPTEDDTYHPGPPSSPFQDQVNPEHTNLMRNLTPPQNCVSSLESDVFETHDDVEMEVDSKPESNNVPKVEELPDAEDSILYDEQKDTEHCSDMDSSVIRHHVQQTQTRKVSGMTLYHENMSAVFHPDEEQQEDVENDVGLHGHLSYDTGDDTCLSTFSAVPNADMTLFAKLRADSPLKRLRENTVSPRKAASPAKFRDSALETPGTMKRDYRRNGWGDQGAECGSPTTPGRKHRRIDGTPNLLDFTDPLNTLSQHRQHPTENSHRSPARHNPRSSPLKGPERFRSPTKLSLLDFDIPPAPTPRSIPSITPRELESLKSSFLSQISSLKATLSGRDAEVASLKESVADAERRVGEALEEVRNEAARRETIESEQREWERRGQEMESVLRGVKAEIVDGERERQRLAERVEEAEKSKEQLEGKIVELQSQLSAARQASPQKPTTTSDDTQFKTADDVAKEVQDAVEKVARELHTLYKGKHETKVAALKKSYEARWEKRVREAEKRYREAIEENERLKNERDTAMSGAHDNGSAGETTMLRENENLEAEKHILEAKVKGLEQEILSVRQDNESLSEQLKNERSEKGELVAVVDEWLAMQQQQQQQQQQQFQERSTPPPPPPHGERQLSIPRIESSPEEEPMPTTLPKAEFLEKPTPAVTPARAPSNHTNENIPPPTSNIARFGGGGGTGVPGGARPRPVAGPTPKVPRFGMPGGHARGSSRDDKGASGIPSKTPVAPRSGIMSSIEKMGRGGL